MNAVGHVQTALNYYRIMVTKSSYRNDPALMILSLVTVLLLVPLRARILAHDRAYWKDRPAPDAAVLFKDFWQWEKAPKGTDPKTANPLEVFTGYWNYKNTLAQ